jgi:anhydro-N-acetylmuramic acid kinase
MKDPGGTAGIRASSDALRVVREYRQRGPHWIVGLMSGTSADGVDAALVRFEGFAEATESRLEAYRETPLEAPLRREILEVAAAETVPPERLMRLDAALGERYAAAVLELLAQAGRDPAGVDAVGLHGQTVRHLPRAEGSGQALSLQLGAAAVVAERTGITVVSDFRARDTAAGGEGAPLVPLADWWIFRSPSESRVMLNLGGIANLTYLPRGARLEDVIAFDTGPGNVVLDALMSTRAQGAAPYDAGGEAAARGQPSQPLLEELLADAFFRLDPPRSTGRERVGRGYADALRRRGAALGLSEDDLLATAVELTAASVAEAVRRHASARGADAVYASGGGVRNAALMKAIGRRLAPLRLATVAELGVSEDGKEALAFAFLAHQTLAGLPGNVPGATGAAHLAVLGQITPGAIP